MKYLLATDIHLNFTNAPAYQQFIAEIKQQTPTGLFLTGDISEAPLLADHLSDLHRDLQIPIYFVLGNHDYYDGTIKDTRLAMKTLANTNPNLVYLRHDALPLTQTTFLVGVDGWGDARTGFPASGKVVLNDWQLIGELRTGNAHRSVESRIALCQEQGMFEANILAARLRYAAPRAARIIVLTHVPPFPGATWHEGKQSGPDWLPWFCCVSTGEVLAAFADEFPAVSFEVYCGHTHGNGVYRHAENLVVHTNGAKYGKPAVAMTIEV